MDGRLFKVLSAVAMLVLVSLACSALGAGALLEDNFEGDSIKWGTGTDADSSVEYSDGGLRMKAFKGNYIVWSTPNVEPYENIHVEATVKSNNTDPSTTFGLICNFQEYTDVFYYFAITPNGDYVIANKTLVSGSIFLTNSGDWGTSDLIAKDKESYRLGADCGNGVLTMYVDGQKIDSVSDSSYTKGNIGLLLWSGADVKNVDVTFDDFVVKRLK